MPEETLLSELCTTSPPKYRCPRCSVRTCSLPCARKHKTWSQCSGVRDPAAYRTRAQLQDPASFDRDFNFITGIERGLERAEREADRRGIQLDHEYMLDPTTTSNSRNKRKRGGGGGDAASLLVKGELAFVRAAEAAGVMLVRAPRGLTRRKLNRSRVHPKHKCLNWSVEWILASTGQSLIRPCLENTALRDAYDRVLPRPKDDTASATTTTAAGATASEERSLSHRNVYFYLHRQRTPASHRRTVLAGPLSPTATLREVLRGRSVVEFPTVYVLQDDALMEGGDRGDARFVLEEVYLRENPGEVDGVDGEEEEDYTSSEGTSSDEASDDDDDDDEEEAEDEVMQQSRSDG